MKNIWLVHVRYIVEATVNLIHELSGKTSYGGKLHLTIFEHTTEVATTTSYITLQYMMINIHFHTQIRGVYVRNKA